MDITLDLDPGNYFVLDNPQLPDPVIETFTVVESGEPTRRSRTSEGTIHLGPNMVIGVPDDFDGTGVWEFVNDDPDADPRGGDGPPRRRQDDGRRDRLGPRRLPG